MDFHTRVQNVVRISQDKVGRPAAKQASKVTTECFSDLLIGLFQYTNSTLIDFGNGPKERLLCVDKIILLLCQKCETLTDLCVLLDCTNIYGSKCLYLTAEAGDFLCDVLRRGITARQCNRRIRMQFVLNLQPLDDRINLRL